MRASLIFLAFAAAVAAQPSFDPYQFIDKKGLHNADVNQLWRTLGISGKIRETTVNGAKDTSQSFSCYEDDHCEGQRVSLDWPLVDGDGEDAVVRIAPAYLNANMRRFLVFHREAGSAWKLVDYLDSKGWDYDHPQLSVVSSGGMRWLVATSWPHCGTGCNEHPMFWYELKNGKLRMVLTVPRAGGQFNENPARQFETRFVRASRSGGRETLEFVYHVEYSSGIGSSIQLSDLWDDEKAVKFSRTTGQGEFEFDAKSSELSQDFVKDIFSSEDLGPPRLFQLVQDYLLQIARGPHNRRREWLKELLVQDPNLPELAPVRAAFAKAP
jgi:hypothetical protein